MKAAIVSVLIAIAIGVIAYGVWRASPQRQRDALFAELRASPRPAHDFSTAEGAILCLEDAFRRRDIEAAVAAKDFKTEARLLLKQTGFRDFIDDASIAKTAEILETSFRADTTQAWPDFDGLESYFTSIEAHEDGTFIVTEICRFPDGGLSQQRLLTTKTSSGWRVLNPLSE